MPREQPDFSKVSLGKMSGAVDKVSATASQQMEETLKMVSEALKRGAMPNEIFDVSPNTVEFFYAQAYTLYNQGKYTEALYLFQLLIMMDPSQSRHALGSAACLHRLGKYEAAGQVYLLTAPLDPENPLPHFHGADCYIKLKVYDLAVFCLKKCIEVAGKREEFALIKERVQMMLETCQKQVEQEAKDYEDEQKGRKKENK